MDDVTEKLGNLLLKGWTMLGNSCPQCLETPLMRSRDKKIYCGKCDIYLSQDMQSVEHIHEPNICVDSSNDDSKIVKDCSKDIEFNPYENVDKIVQIPLNDDSIHLPEWNPDKYITKKINIHLADKAMDVVSDRLECYIKLLECRTGNAVDVERELKLISLINNCVSIIVHLRSMK